MNDLTKRIIALARSENNPMRAAYLLGFASQSSWMPVFNIWLEDCGLKGTQIGLVAAIPWVTMLFVQPLWGIIADRYGKLRILRIAIIVAIIIFCMFPFSGKGIIPTAFMTLALALFFNPVLPLLDSMALDQVEGKKNISYSNIRFWGAPGYGLGAVVTGLLIQSFGAKAAFYSGATFLILVWLVLLRIDTAAVRHKGIDLEFRNLANVIKDKILLIFLLIIMIVAIGQSSITFYLSVYMREIGASPRIIGTAIGVEGFSELPFYFIAAWLLTRMKPGGVALIAIFATVIRLFLYSVNTNPNLVIFIEMMNGMTWTLLWISSVEFVNSLIPAKWRSTGQSLLWASYYGGGSIFGNVMSGRLYESMAMQKVYAVNSLVIAMVAVLSLTGFLLSNRKSKIDDV